MDKRIQVAAVALAAVFAALVLTSPDDPIPIPRPAQDPGNYSVIVVAENLDKPRAIAASGDLVYVTEREGRIRVVQDGTLLESPLAVFRDVQAFDGGLLGIALHPDFERNRMMYVFLTYAENGTLWNKVLRITESGNRLHDIDTVMEGIPGSQFTNGGFVKFGPDGKLYVGTGTVSEASHLPQDPDSLAGKILRINDDGTIPDDNPFEGSPVYSMGHRQPQGMAWDDAGVLYVAEHGPDKNDEINVIEPGGNYGWPEQECSEGEHAGAVLCYDPSIEPGGIIHYTGGKLDLEHPFVMASLRASNLYQVDPDVGLPSQQSILSGVGRIRDVVQAPDGSIYVITSNTDGKGFPEGADDRLLRVVR